MRVRSIEEIKERYKDLLEDDSIKIRAELLGTVSALSGENVAYNPRGLERTLKKVSKRMSKNAHYLFQKINEIFG
jgi:predicted metallopeptidase